MQDKPIVLVTGADQRLGLQIAKDLVARGYTVLVGSRNRERGEAAAPALWGHFFWSLQSRCNMYRYLFREAKLIILCDEL